MNVNIFMMLATEVSALYNDEIISHLIIAILRSQYHNTKIIMNVL